MSREFYVPCTPYAYQILSKLPSIVVHLRRFMGLSRSSNVNNEESSIVSESDAPIRRCSSIHQSRNEIVETIDPSLNSDDDEPIRMVSNSTNTFQEPRLSIQEIWSHGVIVARQLTDLTTILSQADPRREREPRGIPLVYVEDEARYELDYRNDAIIGESSFDDSSTFGSDVGSSSLSEMEETSRRNRGTGQEETLVLRDPPLYVIIRKPIYRQDDDPSIF